MSNSLKFKIDENLPTEIVDCLIFAKYDAITVVDQGLIGANDCKIAEVCKKEERIIVTLDTDFMDIRTYPPDKYSGIIVIRVKNQSKRHIINIFTQTIPLLKSELINHHLWIIEENRIRIRGEKEKQI
jgi:predicted nuclease of predicted toxin-antitoxin system